MTRRRSAGVLAGGSDTLWRLRPKVLVAVADEAQVAGARARMRDMGIGAGGLRLRYTAPTISTGAMATCSAGARHLRCWPCQKRPMSGMPWPAIPKCRVIGNAMGLLRRLLGTAAAARSEGDVGAGASGTGPCYARARSLLASGRAREALTWLERCDASVSLDLDATLGWCLLQLGRTSEAVARFQRAANANPGDVSILRVLAAASHAAGRQPEAESYARQALHALPDDAETLVALSTILLRKNDLAGADAALTQATRRGAADRTVWPIRAVLAAAQGNFEDGIAFREKACDAESAAGEKGGDAFVLLAGDLLDAGRIDDVTALLEHHLPRQPACNGHLVYAMALLKRGDLRAGWHQLEFRWLNEPQLSLRPKLGQPVWSGQDVRGKVVLLYGEQGLGDVIQFSRYAAAVKGLGATVFLFVSQALSDLARRIPGVDRVVLPGEAVPAPDFHIHLMSLPAVFDTGLDTIPATVPYVSVAEERKQRWSRQLAGVPGLRVGLVWAGSAQHVGDRQRSIALERLGTLGTVPGVSFISLQKGHREEDANTEAGAWFVERLGPELEDLADAAAVIDELDLVICVDTALAHLAGALGKPVWVLLPTPADFRWMEEREDSPWYPTMRLFRQRERDQWDDVIERVKLSLEEVVRSGGTLALRGRVVPAPLADLVPVSRLPREAPGHRPGMSAVAETRHGILQYLPDEADVGDALGWYGEWLEGQREWLVPWLAPGMTVLEVGAGVGAHAIWLARMLGESGHLMLREARAVHERILGQNLSANRIGNATVLRELEAVDDLQLERLDWLKCNDAAASEALLAGGSDTLWRLRPKVMVAAADEAQAAALARKMREMGYRCWRIETALYSVDNFNRRDGDMFGGRTALALLAMPEEADVGGEVGVNDEIGIDSSR